MRDVVGDLLDHVRVTQHDQARDLFVAFPRGVGNHRPAKLIGITHRFAHGVVVQQELAAQKLSLPPEKLMVNIDRYGNTSSASVLLALLEAYQQDRLQAGDIVVLASFGAGLTWAAVALEVEA